MHSASVHALGMSPAAQTPAPAQASWSAEDLHAPADQDTWLLSFIDILMLLLTLFVLLLVSQPEVEATRLQEQTTSTATTSPENALPGAVDNRPPMIAASPVPDPAPATPPAPALEAAAVAPVENTSVNVPEGFLLPALGPLTLSGPGEAGPGRPLRWLTGDFSFAASEEMSNEDAPVEVLSAGSNPDGQVSAGSNSNALHTAPDTINPASDEVTGKAIEEPPVNNVPGVIAEDPLQALLAQFPAGALQGRVEVQRLAQGIHLEIQDDVLFPPASAALTTEGTALLDELAATLAVLPYLVSVEGHTDNRPIATTRFPSNWELSSARATQVTRHLIAKGIGAERIRAIGYADTRPRSDNLSAQNRAKNRRVSFLLRLPPEPLASLGGAVTSASPAE